MKASNAVGLLLIVIGFLFSVVGYTMIYDSGVTFRAFLAGPAIFLLGIGMIVFPSPATIEQLKVTSASHFLKELPLKNKIIWSIFGIVGFLIGENFSEKIYLIINSL
jgi:hypothetical protein